MIRRIAVTGATGFIGRHVVGHLLSRGDEVRAIVRPESRRAVAAGAVDVRTPFQLDELTKAFAGTDVVVHPDQTLTDDLALAIAVSAHWLSQYFRTD